MRVSYTKAFKIYSIKIPELINKFYRKINYRRTGTIDVSKKVEFKEPSTESSLSDEEQKIRIKNLMEERSRRP